jgi:hypothetical protein
MQYSGASSGTERSDVGGEFFFVILDRNLKTGRIRREGYVQRIRNNSCSDD